MPLDPITFVFTPRDLFSSHFFPLIAITFQFEDLFVRLMFQTGRPAWRESCSLPDPLFPHLTPLCHTLFKFQTCLNFPPRNFQKGLSQLLELLIINGLLFNTCQTLLQVNNHIATKPFLMLHRVLSALCAVI